jgi:hypothetical protein
MSFKSKVRDQRDNICLFLSPICSVIYHLIKTRYIFLKVLWPIVFTLVLINTISGKTVLTG